MHPDELCRHFARIEPSHIGQRFDKTLAQLFPQYSRRSLQSWIRMGLAHQGDQCVTAPDAIVRSAGTIELTVDLQNKQPKCIAQPGKLEIVDEDDALLILNKPAGLVVHPGAGQPEGTLVNLLLYRFPSLAMLPRAGLIHRLDKGTTGLLMVAKTSASYVKLTQALEKREIQRQYLALVHGQPPIDAVINKAIGRDRWHRTRMAVCSKGRSAYTYFQCMTQYQSCAQLKVTLGTGRTHQIRVHCSDLGYPLVGDRLYGGRTTVHSNHPAVNSYRWDRPALHAFRLKFTHPLTLQIAEYIAPLPHDLKMMLTELSQEK